MIGAKILSWKMHNNVGDFLPLQCSAGSLTFPITEMLRRQVVVTTNGPTSMQLALAGLAWVAVYYVAGWWKLRRSDW